MIEKKQAIIYPHSITKHEVLRDYLIRYVEVLASDPRNSQFRLVLVDGFAGGGVYKRWDNKQEHEGSPLIMMRAIQEAENILNQKSRPSKLEIKPSFFFVEKDSDGFKSLKNVIEESDAPFRENVNCIHGDFSDKYLGILREIQKTRRKRAIFLLDQYGSRDVHMHVIKTIFHILPKGRSVADLSH